MSNKINASLIRSRSFGGHLNKNWIERDLPRYQLTYGGWQPRIVKVRNHNNGIIMLTSFGFPHYHQKRVKVLNSYGRQMEPKGLEKIILHSSSGKLLQSPSNSTIIDLAFSTVGCQTPTKVYSRRSIAGFKLSKFALLGAKTTLRNLAKYDFYYKFYYLGAGETNVTAMTVQSRLTLGEQKQQQPHLSSISLAVKNVFIFNELDSLDYDAFSNIAGFEIAFTNKRSF